MTKQQQIQELIIARNNGDLTAQAKIDALFCEHREETQDEREASKASLNHANAEAYAN
jgi:hypothetical protein